MAAKVTAPSLRKLKQSGQPIVSVTAYDIATASIVDEAGVDMILVGDSMGNVIQGHGTTIPVQLEHVIYHTEIAARVVKRALLVADLPFGSYQVSDEQAVESSIALIKAGAEAVKLEGAYSDRIEAIVRAGIPVVGHVGMTPQSVNSFGGFKVQGKGDAGDQVLQDAITTEEAGACAVVLEVIPAELSKRITEALTIPTIGIGAGPHCDGQIQVFHDLLGLSESIFKHAKAFVEGRKLFIDAVSQYTDEVRERKFPTEDNSF